MDEKRIQEIAARIKRPVPGKALTRPGLEVEKIENKSRIRDHFREIHAAAWKRCQENLSDTDRVKLSFVPPYDTTAAEEWLEDAKALDDEECRALLARAMVEIEFLQKDRNAWLKQSVNHRRSKSDHGKKAAAGRYGQEGGDWSKDEKIKSEWASGKYGSRNACAKALAPILGWEVTTARRHLEGTPDPVS